MTGGQAGGDDAATPAVSGPDPEKGQDASRVISSTMISDAIGGPRGMLDTGIPAVIFVVVNAATSLTPAIFAALGFGVLLVALRLARKQPIQQALAGFVGVGIAALVASRTHSAKGFFLPGILYQAALTVAAIVSLIIRRPLIGYVMAAIDPRYAHWRTTPKLLRAMSLGTLIWGSVFAFRAVVQGLLYLADRPGWLAAVQLAQGWPLFAAALAATYALARRAEAGAEVEPGTTAQAPASSEQLTP